MLSWKHKSTCEIKTGKKNQKNSELSSLDEGNFKKRKNSRSEIKAITLHAQSKKRKKIKKISYLPINWFAVQAVIHKQTRREVNIGANRLLHDIGHGI